MTRDLTSSNGIGSFFTGKARTVAAVAAFSGLALATTVSVHAAPAQDGTADAPLSALAAASPSAAPAVSLEPVAHVTKAEKKAQPRAEQKAPAAIAAPTIPAPVAAPVPDIEAPKPAAPAQAVATPRAAPVAQAAPKPSPQIEAPTPKPDDPAQVVAAKAQPVAQAAPKVASKTAERITPQVSASGQGATIASAARGQLGVGQDCTALVTNALRAAGINFRGWPADYFKLGAPVTAGQAQPGDLVYYADGGMGTPHIGVYVGGGKAVHGGWNGGSTVLDSVNVGSGPVYIRVR